MATRQTTSAPKRGRKVQPKQQRMLFILGFIGLLIVIVIGSVATIGRNASEQQTVGSVAPITISDHPIPANAEPNGRAWGPENAPIQVIEYADYECEACGAFASTYEADFIAAFAGTGKVRFEIRNAPFHGEGSRNAAAAAYCATEQNAFWPMHNSLFANQPVVEGTGTQVFSNARLSELAAKLNLDTAAFDQCLTSGKYTQQVEEDLNLTQQQNITRTPTFVINGQPYPGVISVDQFRQIFAQIAPDITFTS